ncbi:MAG: ROK family protein [Terriglobia bacterium]|jgi:glucokinase|nr:ROK family protein [Terriglobia bacterium]
MKALAIDFGGTHATCGLVDDRQILAHETIDTDRAKSLIAVLPRIADTFRSLLKSASLDFKDCAGIGVGMAALIDGRIGQVLSTNEKYPDALGFDLNGWSHDTFDIPLRLENDARMALLGEVYAGAARGYEDAVMMTLGTGIGGVAMIEGKLLRGKHGQAGCLGGHIPAVFNGRACNCGAIGCAEAEAAGWSLPFVVKDWPGISGSALAQHPVVGFKELFEEANLGDKIATAIRDRCLNIWAADAVGLVHSFDPEIIVIGGGVMKSADIIIPYVETYVQKHAWTPWGKVKVRAAELGNNAALLGAIPLLSES